MRWPTRRPTGLQLLLTMERSWFAARAPSLAGAARHAPPLAIDILAAAPLVSATSLAGGLGMAVKNATALLDDFAAAGIAVEVTHRSKRRLFGLTGLAPLRDEVAPPRRPEPGRGRGRPKVIRETPEEPPVPLEPLSHVIGHVERRAIDYSDLEHWMTYADQAMRDTRRTLDALARAS